MAKKFRSGRVVISTAGSPQPLLEESESFFAIQVDITPISDNSTAVAVGGTEVRAAATEESGYIISGSDVVTETEMHMSDIWVDAITDDDGVRWVATFDDSQ